VTTPGLVCIVLSFVLSAVACTAGAAPVLRVTPADVIEGEPVHVVVEGLSADEPVRLHASRRWSVFPTGEEPYRGSASFAAHSQRPVRELGRPGAGAAVSRTWAKTALEAIYRMEVRAVPCRGASALEHKPSQINIMLERCCRSPKGQSDHNLT
jgi:hypothetical protein